MDLVDELQIYRGGDIIIDDNIVIHHPRLQQICDFGEHQYFDFVQSFCSTPSDLTWQLDEMGIDFTTVDEFDLFSQILINGFTIEVSSILFGNINFQNYKLMTSQDLQEPVLYDPETDSQIDKLTYQTMVSNIRKMHGFKRNRIVPRNKTTKQIIIEDAKEDYEFNLKHPKPYSSVLKDQISALINSKESSENFHTVWELPIFVFLDNLRRIQKIKNAELLLQSGYSGFGVDLKKINNKELDWIGSLDN